MYLRFTDTNISYNRKQKKKPKKIGFQYSQIRFNNLKWNTAAI